MLKLLYQDSEDGGDYEQWPVDDVESINPLQWAGTQYHWVVLLVMMVHYFLYHFNPVVTKLFFDDDMWLAIQSLICLVNCLFNVSYGSFIYWYSFIPQSSSIITQSILIPANKTFLVQTMEMILNHTNSRANATSVVTT